MLTDIHRVLELEPKIVDVAKKLEKEENLLVMARGYQFATALEGALVGFVL